MYTREELPKILRNEVLSFHEMDSRMNYGLIGQLKRRGEVVVIIFPKVFYVKGFDFPLNDRHLNIIKSIQKEFTELTRDKTGKIITFRN